MTGAGVVQSASAIGFEILYAGYRWDNPAPQMYYVRNRFLLPQIGTWNKRDPVGYVDGMALYEYCGGIVLSYVDPAGLQRGLPLRPQVRGPIRSTGGPRLANTPDPETAVDPPRPWTHAPVYMHQHPILGQMYEGPRGEHRLYPYFREDMPGFRNGVRYPNVPSKYDPSTWPGESVAGKPMVMSAHTPLPLPGTAATCPGSINHILNHNVNYNNSPLCAQESPRPLPRPVPKEPPDWLSKSARPNGRCHCCQIVTEQLSRSGIVGIFFCEDLLPVDCVLRLGVCLPDYIEEGVYDTSHDLQLRAFQWDKRFPMPRLK
jgi:RHS repeat-associated protein